MIERNLAKGGRRVRRCWKTTFALLLVIIMTLSFAPGLTASALYLLSDGVSTLVVGDVATVDESRIVALGMDVQDGDMALGAGRKVIIRRDGEELYATSREGETVTELLRREDVSVGALDMVFVTLSGEDAVLEVAADFTYYETESEPIPYGTVTKTDHTIAKDSKVVTQKGENGVRERTYEVIYADGELVARQCVSETEQAPKDEIISVGTLVTEAQPGDTIASVVSGADGSGYLLLNSGDSMHFTGSMVVSCTAYSSEQSTVGTRTATGTKAQVGVVAVDRKVIPLGTKMFVTANDGSYTYGMGSAEDTGVRGKSVDLYMDTIRECLQFGRRSSTVYFLD